MPNCFNLTRKGENVPTSLVKIDEELCAHLNVPVHPTAYHRFWYELIGFALATGHDFQWCREQYPDYIQIIDWLDSNFTSNAWVER